MSMQVPGTLGKHQIRRQLGAGAMGTVYEGWDPVIERRLAIKTVQLPHAADEETAQAIARFRREAQAAGRLTHPNIVGVFDYGETDTIAYIVMEFVDGPALKDLLDRHERFSVPTIARIMEDLLAGLQFSHERGVVHRDIKPANVMLTKEGQAKIADFGIARIESSSMTQAGTMLGTPAYMSPEQFMGLTVDARSDIYSSGVLLYQLLTGERPFDGSMTSIMHKALNTDPPVPSRIAVTVPKAFDTVVGRAMAKRPEDRFASASDFMAAIRGAIAAPARSPEHDVQATVIAPSRSPKAAAPVTAPLAGSLRADSGPQWSMKSPAIIGAGVAGLALLGGVGFFLLSGTPNKPVVVSEQTRPPAVAATSVASMPGVAATPSTPGVDATAGTPGVAGTPSTPGAAATPSAPGVAATPSTPSVAATPSTPGVAATPSTPGVAATPSTPGVAATPSTPGVAATPSTPGVAATPSTPGVAGTPSAAGVAPTASAPDVVAPPGAPATVTPPLAPASSPVLAAPAPAAPSPLERARLEAQSVPCSVLNVADGPRLSGLASGGQDLDRLLAGLRDIGPLTDDVARVDRFACAPIAAVAAFVRQSWDSVPPAFVLRPAQREVTSGARLAVDATTTLPAVYIDIFQADGSVRHLVRPPRSGTATIPHAEFVAGPGAGPALIVAIGSDVALDLNPRPEVERAADYLAVLQLRLHGAARPASFQGEVTPLLADVAMVTVLPAVPITGKPPVGEPRLATNRPSDQQTVKTPPQPHPQVLRSSRCANIISRAQLGETLSDGELAALRTECRS